MNKQGLLLLLISCLGFSLIQSTPSIHTKASTGDPASRGQTDLSAAVAVKAAGRGGPWINLSDRRDIPTVYEEAAEIEQGRAIPLALSSAILTRMARPICYAATRARRADCLSSTEATWTRTIPLQ